MFGSIILYFCIISHFFKRRVVDQLFLIDYNQISFQMYQSILLMLHMLMEVCRPSNIIDVGFKG